MLRVDLFDAPLYQDWRILKFCHHFQAKIFDF